jgi:hypothetical protein
LDYAVVQHLKSAMNELVVLSGAIDA